MNKFLDERELCDLECLAIGAFHPLTSYMTKAHYEECLKSMTIDANVFPIPIVLSTESFVEAGTFLQLKNSTGLIHANLRVNECWKPDLVNECISVFGCYDENHPYIQYLLKKKNLHYVSGSLTIINTCFHNNYTEYRKTPAQLKALGPWTGFQTRNPLHRSHIELIKNASGQGRILLHPVEGVTQECDIPFPVRMACYQNVLPYLGDVTLSILPLSMRMAGPREALWHAIIRRNYGCTHFIVGRDHAGPSYKKKDGSSFYSPLAAQMLCKSHEPLIGITILTSQELVYCENVGLYKEVGKVSADDSVKQISGTELRSLFDQGKPIPSWYSYPEVVRVLESYYTKPVGVCYYFMGLSGSGKTTYAEALKGYFEEQLQEVTLLDADIIRTHLSKGLGFSKEDRSMNVRRIGYVASEIVRHGGIVIVANIAPYEEDRAFNRSLISQNGRYVEIFVDTSLDVCMERDVKGLYKAACAGTLANFTGISDPFEAPKTSIVVTPIQKNMLDIPLKAFLPQLRIRNKVLVLCGSKQFLRCLASLGVVTNSADGYDSLLYSYPDSALVHEFGATKILYVVQSLENNVRSVFDEGVQGSVYAQLKGLSHDLSAHFSEEKCPFSSLLMYIQCVQNTKTEPFGFLRHQQAWMTGGVKNILFVKESELSWPKVETFLGLEKGAGSAFPTPVADRNEFNLDTILSDYTI